MPKFSLEKIIHAKRKDVFSIFSNFEQHEQLIPQFFPSIRIRSVRGETAVVEEHFKLGEIEFLLMSKHVSKPFVLHEVFVIGGKSKGSYIRQEFIEIPDGTKILIDVDLKLMGIMKIPKLLDRSKLIENYSKLLDELTTLCEKSV
ncbi:polyketide cyclase [Nitrosopumilus sp. Nsub]|uniref:polyketide cyclase n=1 Tax=Nitrosopumilus sp. Nsub TaxID=1776294 RepID=UPI00082A58BB|nr:polyketide cyclase [Nitrosopumilus sp. Nsub]